MMVALVQWRQPPYSKIQILTLLDRSETETLMRGRSNGAASIQFSLISWASTFCIISTSHFRLVKFYHHYCYLNSNHFFSFFSSLTLHFAALSSINRYVMNK